MHRQVISFNDLLRKSGFKKIKFSAKQLKTVPDKSGIYILLNKNIVKYIGWTRFSIKDHVMRNRLNEDGLGILKRKKELIFYVTKMKYKRTRNKNLEGSLLHHYHLIYDQLPEFNNHCEYPECHFTKKDNKI